MAHVPSEGASTSEHAVGATLILQGDRERPSSLVSVEAIPTLLLRTAVSERAPPSYGRRLIIGVRLTWSSGSRSVDGHEVQGGVHFSCRGRGW